MKQEMRENLKRIAIILIFIQMIIVLYSGILVDLGCPTSIRYLTDIINLLLFCLCVIVLKKTNYRSIFSVTKVPLIAMIIWVGFSVINGLIKGASVFQIAWAGRNWCRFFVFFFTGMYFVDQKSLNKLISFFRVTYWINFVLVLFEFLVFHLKQDYLGGIFGTALGCNGSSNVFFCIALIYVTIQCCKKKKLTVSFGLVSFTVMLMAALEELKLFFYEYFFIVLCILAMYWIKKNITTKNLSRILLATVVSFFLGIIVFANVHPNQLKFLQFNKVTQDYEKINSRLHYKISRTHFVDDINEMFFDDDPGLNLTGYGFGNCEYSKYDIFTSDFYRENEEANYLWFSHQTLFLEGGFLGLGLYTILLFSCMIVFFLSYIKDKEIDAWKIMGLVYSALCIINLIYNSAMRVEIAYVSWGLLAICFHYYSDTQCGKDTSALSEYSTETGL